MKRELYCCVALLIVSFFTACDNAAPIIARFNFEVKAIHNPLNGEYSEELSLWMVVSDDDGAGDLQEMLLSQSTQGLTWMLDKETWIELETVADRKIGHVKVQGPDPENIPTGMYTVQVSDSAYNVTSRSFLIAEPDFVAREVMPRMTKRTGSVWDLYSRFTTNYIYALDEFGEIVGLASYAPGPINLQNAIYRTYPLYIMVRYKGRALLSGPYFLD